MGRPLSRLPKAERTFIAQCTRYAHWEHAGLMKDAKRPELIDEYQAKVDELLARAQRNRWDPIGEPRHVKDRTDIESVVSGYVTLSRAGQNLKGLCPFHNEKTPSFTVSPSKQLFKCFGCGEGGDVFKFLMKREGMTFLEAVHELGRRTGISLPFYR